MGVFGFVQILLLLVWLISDRTWQIRMQIRMLKIFHCFHLLNTFIASFVEHFHKQYEFIVFGYNVYILTWITFFVFKLHGALVSLSILNMRNVNYLNRHVETTMRFYRVPCNNLSFCLLSSFCLMSNPHEQMLFLTFKSLSHFMLSLTEF